MSFYGMKQVGQARSSSGALRGEGRPALGKPWEKFRKRANIDDTANIHCLRHTFASWAVMGGLSLAQTGALLGHKSAQTTLRMLITSLKRSGNTAKRPLISSQQSEIDETETLGLSIMPMTVAHPIWQCLCSIRPVTGLEWLGSRA